MIFGNRKSEENLGRAMSEASDVSNVAGAEGQKKGSSIKLASKDMASEEIASKDNKGNNVDVVPEKRPEGGPESSK